MRARSLLLTAGTVLPSLGHDFPPSERPVDLSSAGSAPKRTNAIAEGERGKQQHAGSIRRLQLDLQEASEEEPLARSDVAYAALLMDEHDRGIRTLGQSLIDSRTSADLVAILGSGVSTETETRMRAQGWRIRRLSGHSLGHGGEGDAYDVDDVSVSVLAHASVWALTEYKRVVLLADNMLVMENIDDLFQCPGICAAMQQAEVVSTSLVVLEPDHETHRQMSQAVGTIYSFSDDFQGFLNSYLAGFETCALFDLENPSLQDPSTDPNRGPDATLLDHSCHRLPTRYNGDLGLVMLNGGLGMVRTKNAMPEEWWRQRRARVVRYDFAGLRPWMWFASPFLPFVSAWECAHLRAQPGDSTPNMLWVLFVWLSFVVAATGARVVFAPMVSKCLANAETSAKSSGGWPSWGVPRVFQWNRRRRGGSASSYNPRGLLWSLVHLAVGYSSLCLAAKIGVGQVPAAATVKVSWTVFITWTVTVFGILWSAYLWLVSRQPQLGPAPRHSTTGSSIGNGNNSNSGPLDLANRITTTNLCFSPSANVGGSSTDPFKPKTAGDGGTAAGNAVKVGGVSPSPWRESVASLALLAAVLAFLPAWKPLSGATTLPALLGPAVLLLATLFVGMTVQMIRLPVLWCDRLRFLALMKNRDEQMQPCRNCGRIE